MRGAVYNSAIQEIYWKSVNRASRSAVLVCVLPLLVILAALWVVTPARAGDWSAAEQQLARKVVAVTGPGSAALMVENRSSLGRRDGEIVQNGLRSALEQAGLRFVKAEQAAFTLTITLSENPASYVWVAEVRQGTADSAVVMVSVPRSGRSTIAHDSMPTVLRKTLLWTQDDPMLDLTILEENATPTRIAVLGRENVSLYRMQGGKWQQEVAMEIVHTRPWPRDLRGRLLPGKDHLLDAYLPGVICRSGPGAPATLSCHDSDDPWPMMSVTSAPVFPSAGSLSTAPATRPVVAGTMAAFFAPTRNFFTGVLTPAVGRFSTVPRFYSSAFLPRDKDMLWLFAGTDGKVHMIDGITDQSSTFDWGSDIATLRTSCGAGSQVLATTGGVQAQDSIRAYEFPDRDPVAVSAAVDFPGATSALWTEARGDTAIAIVRDRETGSYEAFRLEISCSQ